MVRGRACQTCGDRSTQRGTAFRCGETTNRPPPVSVRSRAPFRRRTPTAHQSQIAQFPWDRPHWRRFRVWASRPREQRLVPGVFQFASYTPRGYINFVVSEWRVAEGLWLLFTAVQPQLPSHLSAMNGTDMQTPSRTVLPLTSSSSGCGCCSTETRSASFTQTGVAYGVEGLTCAGCAASVQRSVSAVNGVESVRIDLVPNGFHA